MKEKLRKQLREIEKLRQDTGITALSLRSILRPGSKSKNPQPQQRQWDGQRQQFSQFDVPYVAGGSVGENPLNLLGEGIERPPKEDVNLWNDPAGIPFTPDTRTIFADDQDDRDFSDEFPSTTK